MRPAAHRRCLRELWRSSQILGFDFLLQWCIEIRELNSRTLCSSRRRRPFFCEFQVTRWLWLLHARLFGRSSWQERFEEPRQWSRTRYMALKNIHIRFRWLHLTFWQHGEFDALHQDLRGNRKALWETSHMDSASDDRIHIKGTELGHKPTGLPIPNSYEAPIPSSERVCESTLLLVNFPCRVVVRLSFD
jgi:hypothetical protein